MRPLLGVKIGRYEVVEYLSSGAAGDLYRVRHIELDRDFTMKIVGAQLAASRAFIRRFRDEAKMMCRLHHRNICGVNDFGTTAEGITFMVMELFGGETLQEVVAREAPLSPWHTAQITRQIASALEEVHRHQLVHRELTPSKIRLVPEGDDVVVKICDFGSEAVDPTTIATLEQTRRMSGVAPYLAPEQINWEPVTHAVDLYALGVMTFEMLSGRLPFEGSAAEIMVRAAVDDAPRLPGSAGLEDLVARLLAKRPDQRPPSAAAMIAELDALVLDWSGARPGSAAQPILRAISNVAAGRTPVR